MNSYNPITRLLMLASLLAVVITVVRLRRRAGRSDGGAHCGPAGNPGNRAPGTNRIPDVRTNGHVSPCAVPYRASNARAG